MQYAIGSLSYTAVVVTAMVMCVWIVDAQRCLGDLQCILRAGGTFHGISGRRRVVRRGTLALCDGSSDPSGFRRIAALTVLAILHWSHSRRAWRLRSAG